MKLLSMVIVMLSGFVALSYEILWFRGFSFASGALPLTFAILLFAYLLGLGLGAALVGNRLPKVVEFATNRGSLPGLPVSAPPWQNIRMQSRQSSPNFAASSTLL